MCRSAVLLVGEQGSTELLTKRSALYLLATISAYVLYFQVEEFLKFYTTLNDGRTMKHEVFLQFDEMVLAGVILGGVFWLGLLYCARRLKDQLHQVEYVLFMSIGLSVALMSITGLGGMIYYYVAVV